MEENKYKLFFDSVANQFAEIAGLRKKETPKEEIKNVEVKASEIIADVIAPAPAEVISAVITPEIKAEEIKIDEVIAPVDVNALAKAVEDLTKKLADVQLELSTEREISEKMTAIVETMAKQTSGTAPQKLMPTPYQDKTKARNSAHQERMSQLNKLFKEVKAEANTNTVTATANLEARYASLKK